ncbi:MAG: hypothetical protein M3Q60_13075 [Actinomycetota bacterium]|nr:hypothetical protein [Actinomycetota bacterium]
MNERTEEPLSSMDRRRFLKLGGAGIASAFLLSAMGAGDVFARAASDLEREFGEAAKEYGVPVEILLAMGYVNTRWEMPPPEASNYEDGELEGRGTYGIMALVRNPSADTLGEAARLTGIPESELKTDRRANILGGAALLARSQGEKPPKLNEWFGAVNGEGGNGKTYEAVAGVGGGDLYVDQVIETLRSGAEAKISTGETVALPPQNPAARVSKQGEVL